MLLVLMFTGKQNKFLLKYKPKMLHKTIVLPGRYAIALFAFDVLLISTPKAVYMTVLLEYPL